MKVARPWRRSEHLQDRRRTTGYRPGGGGGMPLPMGKAGGISGILMLLIALVFGGVNLLGGGGGGQAGLEPGEITRQLPSGQVPQQGPYGAPRSADPDADVVDFVSFVLDDVQSVWQEEFQRMGQTYRPAELVLFTDVTDTACGRATSAVGPFYCPIDQSAYLDLDFFRELRRRFGAPGDFAQAYVIAHELAHHVQTLTGISEEVQRAQQRNRGEANELSVRMELQADCLAGVWGYSTRQRGILEPGDLEEGLAAAAAIGDDRIQKQATGRVNPHTWTHGSSEQRVRWFRRGFESGDPRLCDTFSGGI